MIERICGFIHNYFVDKIIEDTFTIADGGISLPSAKAGQYFKIVGSALNDGIYQYPTIDLIDETFTGAIWLMNVPNAVRKIADEAERLLEKHGDALNSPYTSESVIGAYSYTKAAGASQGGDAWLFGRDGIFGSRLNQWRKIS